LLNKYLMKIAYVFPGQGAQFVGMGKEILDKNPEFETYFAKANEILGFDIKKIMLEGTIEELTQTDVTQPAVFIHSVLTAMSQADFHPDMVAGHSLGEFSALVANKTLSFEEGLKLVSIRANAMQKACEANPSTMAAVLGMEDAKVDEICQSIDEVVVSANYNCPGQLVISGSMKGVEIASEKLKEAGAKRVLPLKVGGAFHSPLMESAKEELKQAIEAAHFNTPVCPIYQNYTAKSHSEPAEIKQNLIDQLTGSVKWTQCVSNMIADGATKFVELGPGSALIGMIKKINADVEAVKE
jgi:[acyl-carrier-protein] S-malonyltransferase